MSYIVSTTDPITLADVKDREGQPFVQEGDLKIFFESEATKQEYLAIPVERPEQGLRVSLDNPSDEVVAEG